MTTFSFCDLATLCSEITHSHGSARVF